jgi:hypothetical protein
MNVERFPKAVVVGVVVLAVFVSAAWLLLRQHQASPAKAIVSQPATPTAPGAGAKAVVSQPATPAPTAPDANSEDGCDEAVVLTVRSHSGVSALTTVQNMEGQDIPTRSASEDEGKFTTACYRLENDDPSGDASPQFLKVCKPGTFVLHITGSGKGVFDMQAKPFPEVAHPGGPLLLCNYALDNNRVYDWVLKYQKGSSPAVFLLGSKGAPNIKP